MVRKFFEGGGCLHKNDYIFYFEGGGGLVTTPLGDTDKWAPNSALYFYRLGGEQIDRCRQQVVFALTIRTDRGTIVFVTISCCINLYGPV